MASFFETRHYPLNVVHTALDRVRNISRQDALTPNILANEPLDRPVVVLTFHPHNIPVKKILLNNWNILQDSPTVGKVFDKPPLVANRRDKNIKDLLVRSRLKSSVPLPIGTHPCNKNLCLTCGHLSSCTTIKGPLQSFHVTRHFDCQSHNIIYAISCTKCPLLYIGETGRSLSVRFKEHHDGIRLGRSLAVAEHFNSAGHSIFDIRVMGLWQCKGSTLDRKTLESNLIDKLGTQEPNGLNRKT